MQNQNIRRVPIITCKPRLWTRLCLLVLWIIFGLIELWMIYEVVTAFSSFALGFVVMWGFILFGLVTHFPTTVHIYRDGIHISQWGRGRCVAWDDINFMWESLAGLKPVVLLSSEKFPKYRMLTGVETIFRFRAIYKMSFISHTNYDEAYQFLRVKLEHCYSHRITLRRW